MGNERRVVSAFEQYGVPAVMGRYAAYQSRFRQFLHQIRHSGAGVGIQEEGGVFIRAFFRLGQTQAGDAEYYLLDKILLQQGVLVGSEAMRVRMR